MSASPAAAPVPIPVRLNVSDAFGYWFSGFFDGEGCFLFHSKRKGVTRIGPKMKLTQRADDERVIQYIYQQIGCGKIYLGRYLNNSTTQPWVQFHVTRVADLAELIVPLFEKYPLRTKKAEEFSRWKVIVETRYRNKRKRPSAEEKKFFAQVEEWIAAHRGGISSTQQ